MPFAIELALDPTAGAVVRRVWRELEGAGITDMARSGAHPHLSLGIWDALDLPAFQAALAAFAREIERVPVAFASVRTFSTGAVFLAPEANPALVELHAGFHRRFARLGTGAWEYYAPGRWGPHCTLAMNLADEQVVTALGISRRAPLPLEGCLERIGIVEFRPVKQLCAFPLGIRPG
jgi:hypothetical protein